MSASSESSRYTLQLVYWNVQIIVINTRPTIEWFSFLYSGVYFIKYDYKHIPRRQRLTKFFFFFPKYFLFFTWFFLSSQWPQTVIRDSLVHIAQIAFFPFTFVTATFCSLSYIEIEINLQKVFGHILYCCSLPVWLI